MNHRPSIRCATTTSTSTILLIILLPLLVLASQVLSFQPLMIRNSGNNLKISQMSQNQECCPETTSSTSSSTTSTSSTTLLQLQDVPDDIWDSYVATMTEVMESPRVLKKDKAVDMKVVQNYLISRTCLPCVPSPNTNSDRQRVQEVLAEQACHFQSHYNFTQSQYNFAMRSLVYLGDSCAKRGLGLPITIAWLKLKEAGMIPRENSISTYMYTLSTQAEEISLCRDTLDEVASFHDLYYAPTEKTVFLRMKNMITKNDVAGAEGILLSLPDKGEGREWKRLRTFLPLLEHYCSVEDASSILRLFREMRLSPGVLLDADTYATLIGSLARFGFFRQDSSPVKGFYQAGFTSSHGAKLFGEIATEMASDVLQLSEPAAKQIMDAFLEGFRGSTVTETNDDGNGIPYVSGTASASGLHIGRVDINRTTGLCPASGAKLRLFELGEHQRQHVHDTLLEMARSSYQEFTKNRERGVEEDEDYGFHQLSRFSEWLNTREGDPFSAVIDGANVAYYGFPELHYSQVKLVVENLKRMGEKPLVVLPKKYIHRSFMLSHSGKWQTLSDRDFDIIQSLEAEGIMYAVPPRCLDDYFWMLGSVSNQTVARNKCDLQVSPENTKGRFPGLRPMLVTNDQMRDHKLDLLEPREFRRWCSCHIVNYRIGPHTENEWSDERSVQFVPTDLFSREIQGNAHENGRATVWHFPVIDWDEPARFCVWIDQ